MGSLAEGDQVRNLLIPKIHFVSVLASFKISCVCVSRPYSSPTLAGLSLFSVRPPEATHLRYRCLVLLSSCNCRSPFQVFDLLGRTSVGLPISWLRTFGGPARLLAGGIHVL